MLCMRLERSLTEAALYSNGADLTWHRIAHWLRAMALATSDLATRAQLGELASLDLVCQSWFVSGPQCRQCCYC